MSLAVLVPVKDLTRAKTRLAPLLSEAERQGLALCLLEGVLDAVAALPAAVQRVLVTNHEPAMALGRARGFRILAERRQVSESESVDAASAQLQAEGVTGVLRLPLDLPCITTQALHPLLLRARAGLGAVLVPSLAGTGTNALYRSPPTLFPSRFGPDSLRQHLVLARAATPAWQVHQAPALALDVDDPADVATVLRDAPDSTAARYLARAGMAARLEPAARSCATG